MIVYYANTDHGLLGCLYPYNEPVGLVSFVISNVEIWLSIILLDLQRWRCSFTFSSFRFFAHQGAPGVLASKGGWVTFKDPIPACYRVMDKLALEATFGCVHISLPDNSDPLTKAYKRLWSRLSGGWFS